MNPNVGDYWADEETLEMQMWDGNNWIVLQERPTTPTQFGDDNLVMSAGPGEELTLIAGGVETLKFGIGLDQPDDTITIFGDCEMLVSIDTKTGDVEFGENYDPDETAKIFWENLGLYRHKQGELNVVTVGNDDTGEIGISIKVGDHIYPDYMFSEDRMKSFYELLKMRYTHDANCNWHTWNHYYSWNDSDCTCKVEMMDFTTATDGKGKGSKVEFLPSGLPANAMEDIQYFRDKLARAMELKQIPLVDKLEKQIKVMEVLDEGADISEDEPWYMPAGLSKKLVARKKVQAFDDAMKVIE